MTAQLLDVAGVAQRLSLNASSIYRLLKKDPRFPRPVKLLSDPRWSEDDLAAYISTLRAERDANGREK